MRIRAAGVMGAILYAISGFAQAVPPGWGSKVYGAGTYSCGTWLAGRGSRSSTFEGTLKDAMDDQWLLGWVSAAAYYASRNLRETDGEALFAWVDKYCHEHPLDGISDAAAKFVETLTKPE